jgi:L-tyrosine isonitrile synthase
MRYGTSASIRAARGVEYSDQRSCIGAATQRQPASSVKRPGSWARAVTPEQILKSFSTRAFKREKPDKPELMLRSIAEAHARRTPIPFVQYWGKGLRPKLATPEFTCLDYLDSMMARIVEIYEPGAEFTLVFTDTHAALNGHTQASIHSYFQDLVLATRGRRFKTCLLSSLVNAAGLRPDEMPERQLPPSELLAELRLSAAKWFKGEGSADEGAIRYFQANMLERKVMERAFPGSIFVTFNGSQLRSLFPDPLPIFYMYSLRHGISDKPWFLPPDFTGRKSLLNEQSGAAFRPASESRDEPAP